MSDYLLGADLLGDDLLGDDMGDDLGALRRRRASPNRQLAWRRQQLAPGVSAPGARRLSLGLPAAAFIASTPINTTLTTQTNPQRPFRAERLIINVLRSAGAGAVGIALADMRCGTQSQLAGVSGISADAFPPNAIDTTMVMDPIQPGVNFTVSYVNQLAVPAANEVLVQTTLVGQAVG